MSLPMRLFDKVIGRIVERGRLEITYHDGHKSAFGTPEAGFPDVAIRFADAKVARNIILDPRLGAAETFMDGRLLIERGDVMQLVHLLRANQPWDKGGNLKPPSPLLRLKENAAFLAASFNRADSAKRNISHHYDIGNELYRLMLDSEHMQYSCAYWPREDMSLGEAQEAKLAHIAAKLALEPGQRVLDIGCGWGGMAIYLARHADVVVHGITLSEEQLASPTASCSSWSITAIWPHAARGLTGSSRSACSNMSASRNSEPSSAPAPICWPMTA